MIVHLKGGDISYSKGILWKAGWKDFLWRKKSEGSLLRTTKNPSWKAKFPVRSTKKFKSGKGRRRSITISVKQIVSSRTGHARPAKASLMQRRLEGKINLFYMLMKSLPLGKVASILTGKGGRIGEGLFCAFKAQFTYDDNKKPVIRRASL